MPMPAELKQQITAIGNQLKTANVPGLSDFQMPGGDTELPTVPGVPPPDGSGPTTRPGGAGGTGGAAGGA